MMHGRINGNPSEDIRNAHGVELPSLDVCRSCYLADGTEREREREITFDPLKIGGIKELYSHNKLELARNRARLITKAYAEI